MDCFSNSTQTDDSVPTRGLGSRAGGSCLRDMAESHVAAAGTDEWAAGAGGAGRQGGG